MNTLLLKHVGALKNYGTLKSFTHKCNYKNQTSPLYVVYFISQYISKSYSCTTPSSG